jgi:hypothetical protein
MPVVRSLSTSTAWRRQGLQFRQQGLDGVHRGDDVGAGLALHVQDDGRLLAGPAPRRVFRAVHHLATSVRRTGAPFL